MQRWHMHDAWPYFAYLGGLAAGLILLVGAIVYCRVREASASRRRVGAIGRLGKYLVAFQALDHAFRQAKSPGGAYAVFEGAMRSSGIQELNMDDVFRGDRCALNYFCHHASRSLHPGPAEMKERSMEIVDFLAVELMTAISRRIEMLERQRSFRQVCDVHVVDLRKYRLLWNDGKHIDPTQILHH